MKVRQLVWINLDEMLKFKTCASTKESIYSFISPVLYYEIKDYKASRYCLGALYSANGYRIDVPCLSAPTVEAAKIVCQAHYEALILSGVEEQTNEN